ncbi:MAG: valine--tRNA ligase [Firmicutes bacterium]|nr:valine--tRNA ligase [Bacillota bacterium]
MDKTYKPQEFENEIYNNWLENGYFKANVSPPKKPFSILMPPPNITGQLHIGHALDLTIQDALIRYKRMCGFEALYMPGTDHASIATEMKIVDALKDEGIIKQNLGREKFLQRAFLWNDKYGGRIIDQQKKLGLSCDWDKSSFTMDENRSRAVKEVFIRLYNEGLIYRGERIINWCPSCKTAISDAEVEMIDKASHLYHIKYLIKNENKAALKPLEQQESLIIATTRPETMLGDVAVAVNPKDKRYKNLIGKTLILPIYFREIPVIADDYVKQEFGTGAVKITPSHDPNDFEIGLRHKLESIKVIGDDGIMNENAGIYYHGLNRFEARKKIVEKLKDQGLLVKIEDYNNSTPHCYRCSDIIEPAVKKQWFLKMEDLAKPAIEAVKTGKIKFVPKRFEKQYLHWMENTRDWCISRQLWWGHRIPVWYCDVCKLQVLDEGNINKCKCGGALTQDEDVLDTWFSSALWPFATLNWPSESKDFKYFFPSDVLVTGYDIIGFWVSRMIFSTLKFFKKAPFKTVLIHGIVRDDQGKKMSKSSGNGVDPLGAIDQMGADALRYSLVAGVAMGGDTKYSKEKLETKRNFMNKLWNASRFVMTNVQGFEFEDKISGNLNMADKWILSRLNAVIVNVTKLMDRFEIGLAANELYEFVWNEFCDWYIEAAKVGLNASNDELKKRTSSVLVYVLDKILKLVCPIAPFICAKIYKSMPLKQKADDIMISGWPKPLKGAAKATAIEFEKTMELVKGIRNLRQQLNVPQNKRTNILLMPSEGQVSVAKEAAIFIDKLAMGSGVQVIKDKPEGNFAAMVGQLGTVFIAMGDLVDIEAEKIRLKKELLNLLNEIKRAEGMLKNEKFVNSAPFNVVDAEREKLKKFLEQKSKLEENLKNL